MRQLKSVKGSGCVGKYVVKTVVHTMMRVEGGGGMVLESGDLGLLY